MNFCQFFLRHMICFSQASYIPCHLINQSNGLIFRRHVYSRYSGWIYSLCGMFHLNAYIIGRLLPIAISPKNEKSRSPIGIDQFRLNQPVIYCLILNVASGHTCGTSYMWWNMAQSPPWKTLLSNIQYRWYVEPHSSLDIILSAASRARDCGNPANLVALAQIRVDRAPDGTRSSWSWRRLRD